MEVTVCYCSAFCPDHHILLGIGVRPVLGGIYLCSFCDSQDSRPEEVPSKESRLTKTHISHGSSSR